MLFPGLLRVKQIGSTTACKQHRRFFSGERADQSVFAGDDDFFPLYSFFLFNNDFSPFSDELRKIISLAGDEFPQLRDLTSRPSSSSSSLAPPPPPEGTSYGQTRELGQA